jgi:hypothetical protein
MTENGDVRIATIATFERMVIVSPSLAQFGEIGSIYPVFVIIFATGL